MARRKRLCGSLPSSYFSRAESAAANFVAFPRRLTHARTRRTLRSALCAQVTDAKDTVVGGVADTVGCLFFFFSSHQCGHLFSHFRCSHPTQTASTDRCHCAGLRYFSMP